jgi:hypothetical protein
LDIKYIGGFEMTKIFNARKMECEKTEYRDNFICEIESKKGRIVHTEKGIESTFAIKKPSEKGDNLIASGYANKNRQTTSFFDKKCAVIQVKPIKSDDGKILIESRKEMICADKKSVLKKFIKENEGYF